MQRSGYIVVDSDINEIKKRKLNLFKKDKEVEPVKVRYCKAQEIMRKNNLGLVFKATFLIRLINMKNKGSMLHGFYHLK